MLSNLELFFEKGQNTDIKDVDLNLLMEHLRYLRNMCYLGGQSFQSSIADHPKLVDNCFTILQKCYLHKGNKLNHKPLQLGIQFIGNLIVGHNKNKVFIWSKYFHLLRDWTFHENDIIRNYTEMIIYNLMLDITDAEDCIFKDNDLFEQIFLDASQNGLEFSMILIQCLIKNNVNKVLINLKLIHHHLLLEFLKKSLNENEIALSASSVHFVIKKSMEALSKIMINKNMEITESVKENELGWIEILSKISSTEHHRKLIRNDVELITFIVERLNIILQVGIKSSNVFTPCPEILEIGSPELPYHPLFGVKALLVRIISNLCFKNKFFQDQVRNLNGIKLIMDCCKYDAKNPYITEWAILAISNICNNNRMNQEIVSSYLSNFCIKKCDISKFDIVK